MNVWYRDKKKRKNITFKFLSEFHEKKALGEFECHEKLN